MAARIPLFRRRELSERGETPTGIAQAERRGTLVLVRVRAGVYAPGDEWRASKPERRIVARAEALALVSASRPVFSHETAAALHGLGLYRASLNRVHTITPAERPGAADGVVRHRGEMSDDVVELDGLLCTSLTRTAADVARTATFEQAVTIVDAALRSLCVPGVGRYESERAEEFRRAALEITRRSAHGQTRARRVLDFADGRAQLPGESISRIRLRSLGFRTMILQVPVPSARGTMYFIDFGLEDVGAFGEFDGAIKYIDGKLTDRRSASQVLDEEKQREDWIRGTTQRRYGRWGWPHVDTAATLGARLAAFGILPPR